MARDITSAFQNEINKNGPFESHPINLIKAEFDSGDVRFWTGFGEITFGGEIYLGAGKLLSISRIEETQDLKANNVTFELNGLDSALVSLALSEPYQGRPITLWFGMLDASGQIVADPYQIYKGKMDVLRINDDANTAKLTMSTESDLINLRNANESKYTPENQKIAYPNDKGLDFVPTIEEVELVW